MHCGVIRVGKKARRWREEDHEHLSFTVQQTGCRDGVVAGEEGRGYGLSTEAVGGPGCLTQSANCFPAAAERIKGKS